VKILLLGGYAFVGRALIDAAHARGHTVTAFNRGNHEAPPGVEQLTGDRGDPVFPAGRRWDAAIDTSGYAPHQVRAAAEGLRERIDRYVFTSSISVYPFPIQPGTDESAPTASFHDGLRRRGRARHGKLRRAQGRLRSAARGASAGPPV